MRRTTLALALWLCVAFAIGCGPSWTVLRETVPSPMYRKNGFVVMPIDFTGLRVGDVTEADHMADKDADQRRDWVGDKVAMNQEYAEHLIASAHEHGLDVLPGPASAQFFIYPKVTWLEPGFYAYVASQPSEVEMIVRITRPDGSLIDEIMIRHSTAADMINASSGQRLRDDAEGLGKITADYLQSKVTGEE